MIVWQEQARAFLESAGTNGSAAAWNVGILARGDRDEILGAVSGKIARLVFERTMGGPHKTTLDEMYAHFAEGCHAFLAAYEAGRE